MQATGAEDSLAILKSFVHDNKVAELELAVPRGSSTWPAPRTATR